MPLDRRVIAVSTALLAGCAGGEVPQTTFGTLDPSMTITDSMGDTDPTSADSGDSGDPGDGSGDSGDETAAVEVCGDGIVEGGEECDDANADDGDGCSSSCTAEPGWVCMDEPSTCVESCGDGVVTMGEACDDMNLVDDDGCSASCQIEAGFECMGEPSMCASVCGDGVVAGDEVCDDMNVADGDGCSASCELEAGFECMGEPSMCTTICGDGIVAGGEACDDMNVADGDGCSASCTEEPGYQCSGEPSMCAPVCGDGMIAGGETCDDGNAAGGDGCSAVCDVEPGYQCMGEPSVCSCDASELRFVEMSIGDDYVDIENTGTCTVPLGGLNILFDDSSSTDVDFALPAMNILPGQTLRVGEPGVISDISTGTNILFSDTRGGAALLCTGVCSGAADVIDVVAFSEGAPHPALPAGVTFSPAGLTGITDQFTQVYARIAFGGATPAFLAADWTIM